MVAARLVTKDWVGVMAAKRRPGNAAQAAAASRTSVRVQLSEEGVRRMLTKTARGRRQTEKSLVQSCAKFAAAGSLTRGAAGRFVLLSALEARPANVCDGLPRQNDASRLTKSRPSLSRALFSLFSYALLDSHAGKS